MLLKKAAIVCCSNGRPPEEREMVGLLGRTLKQMGIEPVFGTYLFSVDSVFSGTAQERAESLMGFYEDPEIDVIFDISGGDLANEILPFLNFDLIEESGKLFWGYSDLTTIINAVYARTGRPSVLYQVRNLIGDHAGEQVQNFRNLTEGDGKELFDFKYEFVQGRFMEGIVVGGNIRCLLKLAGTPYWPDMEGKILLLEANGGRVPQMVAYLSQLKQMGVFEKVNGIMLGTFTKMQTEECRPDILELVKRYAGDVLPIAVTQEIGHGTDAKAIVIGRESCFGADLR